LSRKRFGTRGTQVRRKVEEEALPFRLNAEKKKKKKKKGRWRIGKPKLENSAYSPATTPMEKDEEKKEEEPYGRALYPREMWPAD